MLCKGTKDPVSDHHSSATWSCVPTRLFAKLHKEFEKFLRTIDKKVRDLMRTNIYAERYPVSQFFWVFVCCPQITGKKKTNGRGLTGACSVKHGLPTRPSFYGTVWFHGPRQRMGSESGLLGTTTAQWIVCKPTENIKCLANDPNQTSYGYNAIWLRRYTKSSGTALSNKLKSFRGNDAFPKS
jgi:hypothetical protein